MRPPREVPAGRRAAWSPSLPASVSVPGSRYWPNVWRGTVQPTIPTSLEGVSRPWVPSGISRLDVRELAGAHAVGHGSRRGTRRRRRRPRRDEPARGIDADDTAEQRAVTMAARREDGAEAPLMRLVERERDPAPRRRDPREPV